MNQSPICNASPVPWNGWGTGRFWSPFCRSAAMRAFGKNVLTPAVPLSDLLPGCEPVAYSR